MNDLWNKNSSYTKPDYEKPHLERQYAIDNTNLLSPSPNYMSPSSQESSRRSSSQRSPNTLSPPRNATTQSSVEFGSAKSSITQRSPIFTFPDSRRPSLCFQPPASRRPSNVRQDLLKLSRVESHIGSNVRSKRRSPNCQTSDSPPNTMMMRKGWMCCQSWVV